MAFYVATTVAGRGETDVTEFEDKADLFDYVEEITSSTDRVAKKSDTIGELLDLIEDMGPGYGQRTHRRVGRKEAIKLIRGGANNHTFLDTWDLG